MLAFYNSQNQPVKLLHELGRGGEGTVYTCEDDALVGKIYHEPISDEKSEKLLWMAEQKSEQLLKTTAWIAEILKDKPEGKVIGFLMPKIKAKEIHELYAPKSRRIHFPDATWHFLIHTATNLARAFHNLHKDSHVMGDVNQGNCVVTSDGTVKLIDCDSYEITTPEKIYPCEVGVTTHIPPELQGKNLRRIDRSDNHDNFGLAVILFQLLFLGRHPFAGNYLGAEDKTLEDAIREHLFVYGKNAKRKNVVRPPGTPPLSVASPAVAELFERAFSEENSRPKPHEWVQSLEYLGNNLRQCLLNPGHLYYSKITLCPWCEIEENTGLMLFPFTISNNAASKKYERTFDVPTIKNLIGSFDISGTFTSIFSEDIEVISPSEIVLEKRLKQIFLTVLICGGYLASLVYFYYLVDYCFLPVAIIGGIAFWAFFNNLEYDSDFQDLKIQEEAKFESLTYEKNKIESEFSRHLGKTKLLNNLNSLQEKLRIYEKNSSEDSKTGFTQINESKTQLQDDITNLLANLRLNSVKSRQKLRELKSKSENIIQNLPAVSANVKAMKLSLPFSLTFAFTNVILFGLFATGSLPNQIRISPPRYSQTNTPYNTYASPSPSPFYNQPDTIATPPETITDKEIAALSETERSQIIKELIRKSYSTLDSERNEEARRLLRFARRFDKNDVEVMSLLARALFNSKKYKEALKQFDEAMEIDSQKTDKFYLGMTYLQLKRYEEARDVFQKVTSESMSAAGLYNLGSAYMGLKDYETASRIYGMALKLSPGDADSLYQLGICFSKMKDEAGVKDTYSTLRALNSPRADDLREAVSKSIKLNSAPVDTYPSRGTGTGNGIYRIDELPPPAIKQN